MSGRGSLGRIWAMFSQGYKLNQSIYPPSLPLLLHSSHFPHPLPPLFPLSPSLFSLQGTMVVCVTLVSSPLPLSDKPVFSNHPQLCSILLRNQAEALASSGQIMNIFNTSQIRIVTQLLQEHFPFPSSTWEVIILWMKAMHIIFSKPSPSSSFRKWQLWT